MPEDAGDLVPDNADENAEESTSKDEGAQALRPNAEDDYDIDGGERQPADEQKPRKRGKPIAIAVAAICAVAALVAFFLFAPAYTVSFDTAGGSSVAPVSVSRVATVQEPQAPTRDSYDFAGWFLDDALSEKAEFPLAVSSDTTLHAAWNKTLASYRIEYLDAVDGKPVAKAKNVEKAEVGTTVAEKAPTIDGYALDSDPDAKIAISEDDSANVATFKYRKLVSYEVHYRNKGTETDVSPVKTVDDVAEGTQVTETAPAIGGYTLQSEGTQTITVTRDAEDNRIVFYYEPVVVDTGGYTDNGGGSSRKGSSSKSSGSNDVTWAN